MYSTIHILSFAWLQLDSYFEKKLQKKYGLIWGQFETLSFLELPPPVVFDERYEQKKKRLI